MNANEIFRYKLLSDIELLRSFTQRAKDKGCTGITLVDKKHDTIHISLLTGKITKQ